MDIFSPEATCQACGRKLDDVKTGIRADCCVPYCDSLLCGECDLKAPVCNLHKVEADGQ